MRDVYDVAMEVAGPAAMFTRPDCGAAPVSYPAPTLSAARGMFEAIARLRTARIRPTRVEICRPIRYMRYFTNYRGPLRKSNQLSKEASYQLPATILVDVCFRIFGEVREVETPGRSTNHLHHLQAMFRRRLGNGQSFYTPCLGWKEFAPTYVGPLRPETERDESVDLTIPSMFLEFEYGKKGARRVEPVFSQNVRIVKGVLTYAE